MPEDLDALIRSLGQKHYFEERLDRQLHGSGILLVAWKHGEPLGDVYLWLERAEEPELTTHLPDAALLTHLEVLPAHRNEGIGSELMGVAEERLFSMGYKRVALGVGLDNRDAQRLYERRGYDEWPHGYVTTTRVEYQPDGRRELSAEMCRIMVKQLGSDHYEHRW
ncbi:GNAT family N-acetyltransferase [Nonomuraea fuscirosea]|uniref:GNAT family N-acetyltransferase n=1 Tax=Nonomuraea fuscirosea TaxID=1291556 RepID=UPI0034420A70